MTEVREGLSYTRAQTWLSTGLLPLSIALLGPIVAAVGGPATLVAGGSFSAVATGLALTRRGALEPDRG